MPMPQRERRQAPWWVPIVALILSAVGICISGCGLVLGPMLGAGVAVVGVYVTGSNRGAVADEKLGSIEKKVDKLVEQNDIRLRTDGKTEQVLQEYDRRINEAKSTADQALARAQNAQVDAKTANSRR